MNDKNYSNYPFSQMRYIINDENKYSNEFSEHYDNSNFEIGYNLSILNNMNVNKRSRVNSSMNNTINVRSSKKR